mmetsp:Transcript_5994/g.5325  ORF Transcript_5994/g.5325 Transcript_5994/m.5325 type:complete len:201 (-) Transcript_5994:748-1350(-)
MTREETETKETKPEPPQKPRNRKNAESTQNEKTYYPKYLWCMIFNAALGFATFGYGLYVFNSVASYLAGKLFPDASDQEISLIPSITTIGAAFGAVTAGKITSKYGRRPFMIVSDIILLVGVALTLVDIYAVMVIGRFIMGWYIGTNTVVTSLYTTEMAPPSVRQIASVVNIIFLVVMGLFGFLLGFAMPKSVNEDTEDS